MVDAGYNVFANNGGNKIEAGGKPVACISSPLNAIYTEVDPNVKKLSARSSLETYTQMLQFRYNIRIRDAAEPSIEQSYIDRSGQIVNIHVMLVEFTTQGDDVNKELYNVGPVDSYGTVHTDNLAFQGTIENMFERNPLLMDSRNQKDFINLKLRRGANAAETDYMFTDDAGTLPPLTSEWAVTAQPSHNSQYGRRVPFNVLAWHKHRLGSHGTSDVLAHYEVQDQFELKLGKEKWRDGPHPRYQYEKEYRVIILHNGAMNTPSPNGQATDQSITTYGPNVYAQNKAARVYCRAQVRHWFTDS